MNATSIWSPRYWDKKVLVNLLDVKDCKCFLYFCCDKNYPDLYSYDGAKVRAECTLCSNGKIYCYEIPLEWLKNEGELPKEFIPIRDKQYEKYRRFVAKNKNKD